MDIVEKMRNYGHLDAADEIERLQNEVSKWKRLDSQAANYVESVICVRSHYFTGEEPYVGWKGLGLALSQDYDEIERLRKALEHVSCMCLGQCVHGVKDRERCIRYTARSALQQKDSE